MLKTATNRFWLPLLTNARADQAWDAIEAIAGSLVKNHAGTATDPTLSSGLPGIAVFLGSLSENSRGRRYEKDAFQILQRSIDLIGLHPMGPSLFHGFTGTAWATEFLKGRLYDPDSDDPNDEIDRNLKSMLTAREGDRNPRLDHELLVGLCGIGIYALHRLPRPEASEILSCILSHLQSQSFITQDGTAWVTPVEQLLPETRKVYPDGLFNIGVAHGVPGVIGLLSEIHSTGLFPNRVSSLLNGAVRWLLAQRLPDGFDSVFPSFFWPGIERDGSPLAWCYGDMGVAAVLLATAARTGNRILMADAAEIARRAAERSLRTSQITDTALCHGAAGLAHMFNRMYQGTGDKLLGKAAEFWFDRLLQMRRDDRGVGGFINFTSGPEGETRWRDDPGFLTGASGIGLALLAAVSERSPEWDRALMMAVPAKSEAGFLVEVRQ